MQSKTVSDTEFSEQSKVEELLTCAKDILADWLDSTMGHTVNDHSVFSALARKYFLLFLCNLKNHMK